MIIKTIVYLAVQSIIRSHNGLGTFIHLRLLISLLLLLNTSILSVTADIDDISLPTVDIIKNNGYDVEIHKVETEDGYILKLHRILSRKTTLKFLRNYPVFFHHGVFGSSADWVIGGANISLPMQLADDGYDVWLANCRGNVYSREHKIWTPEQKEFWNFSLNEIGIYDLPAAIDHILKNTQTTQIQYMGYSMGTTVFFIMASMKPEYQDKIRSQVSLAPVVSLYNTKSIIKYLAPQAHLFNIAAQFTSNGMIGSQPWVKLLENYNLKENLFMENLILFLICGFDPKFFNSKLIPQILGHMPAGTSSKLIEHFAQFVFKSEFTQFDYGITGNVIHYSSTEPPSYNLNSIQVPITLIYGLGDTLADTMDVKKLREKLPKIMKAIPVNNPHCNHLDFLYSLTVNEDINEPIKQILMETDNKNWVYTEPSPNINENHNEISEEGLKQNIPEFITGLDNFEKNLDTIVTNIMSTINDDEVFEKERDNITKLSHKFIEYMKSFYIKNDLNIPEISYQNMILGIGFFDSKSS